MRLTQYRIARMLLALRADLEILFQPSWGCLFWGEGGVRGEIWGNAKNMREFTEEAKKDFKRWNVRNPFVLMAPAWRIRIVKWALKRELSDLIMLQQPHRKDREAL